MKTKKNNLSFFIYFAFLSLLVASCVNKTIPASKINSNKTLYSYQKDSPKINYELGVYHHIDSKSQLHYNIPCKDLIYVKNENKLQASVKIAYRLLLENGTLIDSLSFVLNDITTKNSINSNLTGNVEINTTYGNKYYLDVKIRDLNTNYELASLQYIDKSNRNSRENFIVKSDQNQIILNNYISNNDTIKLSYNQKNTANQLFVKYYKRDFQLPPPPFVLTSNKGFDYKADSTFTLSLDANNTTPICFGKEGFYHILSDSTSKTGFTLFRFSNGYPLMNSGKNLLPPTRFITTRQEYDDMNINSNKKTAVENFWIKNTGNKDKAKNAIKNYYQRVEKANQYFNSYVEGWKTERGIIYLIFGEPNYIYKQRDSETWVYGEEGNYKSTNFTFIKVINPFTDNDYLLNRSEIFKDEWYRYVDAWRIGKIINE